MEQHATFGEPKLSKSGHDRSESIQGRYISASKLSCLINKFKDLLTNIKQTKCLEVWQKLQKDLTQETLKIDDYLWTKVQNSFPDLLSCSLVKFLSSYICQTGSFELSKSFFLFNLASAADQKKFFLYESLLR